MLSVSGNCQSMFRGYPDVLDATQTGQVLGVSQKTVYKLIRDGKLTAIKVGRAYKVPKVSIIQVFFDVESGNDVFPVYDEKNSL